MAYILLDDNNIVVQKQPNKQNGFIKVDDSVICGMVLVDGDFIEPPLPDIDYSEMIKYALQNEADPLFFKWQAGEITKQEWLDKRQEIIARYEDL